MTPARKRLLVTIAGIVMCIGLLGKPLSWLFLQTYEPNRHPYEPGNCKDLAAIEKQVNFADEVKIMTRIMEEDRRPSAEEKPLLDTYWRNYATARLKCGYKVPPDPASLTSEQRTELRDHYFNGLLGHLGKTNAQRDRLRWALISPL